MPYIWEKLIDGFIFFFFEWNLRMYLNSAPRINSLRRWKGWIVLRKNIISTADARILKIWKVHSRSLSRVTDARIVYCAKGFHKNTKKKEISRFCCWINEMNCIARASTIIIEQMENWNLSKENWTGAINKNFWKF